MVRDALIKDVRERERIDPALAQVDFVVFSGDLKNRTPMMRAGEEEADIIIQWNKDVPEDVRRESAARP